MSNPQPPLDREQLVAELRERLRGLEGTHRTAENLQYSTGCNSLDRLLPAGGLVRGALVEWLAAGEGSGAARLALTAACQACRDHGPLIVIDGEGSFYPPAAVAAGIAAERLFVVRAPQSRDEAWALDQTLRSAGVGAVFCSSPRLLSSTLRRLQLAAESSGAAGMLVRPAAVRDEPCWAEARLLVQPLAGAGGRRLRVELVRARAATAGESVELEFDDETGALHLVAELAPAAAVWRPGA